MVPEPRAKCVETNRRENSGNKSRRPSTHTAAIPITALTLHAWKGEGIRLNDFGFRIESKFGIGIVEFGLNSGFSKSGGNNE